MKKYPVNLDSEKASSSAAEKEAVQDSPRWGLDPNFPWAKLISRYQKLFYREKILLLRMKPLRDAVISALLQYHETHTTKRLPANELVRLVAILRLKRNNKAIEATILKLKMPIPYWAKIRGEAETLQLEGAIFAKWQALRKQLNQVERPLIEMGLNIIDWAIAKTKDMPLPDEDKKAEGILGLYRALENFHPVSYFPYYACEYWIKYQFQIACSRMFVVRETHYSRGKRRVTSELGFEMPSMVSIHTPIRTDEGDGDEGMELGDLLPGAEPQSCYEPEFITDYLKIIGGLPPIYRNVAALEFAPLLQLVLKPHMNRAALSKLEAKYVGMAFYNNVLDLDKISKKTR